MTTSGKIFLFFLLGYIMITAGVFWEYDSHSVVNLTKNFVDHGKFTVDCSLGIKGLYANCYPRYGIFMSLVIIPLYLFEKIITGVLHVNYFPPNFFPGLLNAFVSAGLAVLIYQYLRKIEIGKRVSLLTTLIFGWATYVPAYTKTLFPEPLITLLVLSFFYLILFGRPTRKIYFTAGLLFGLSFLTRVTLLIVLLPVFYVFRSKKTSLKMMICFFIPCAAAAAVFFIYNQMRFGHVLMTGYQPVFNSRILDGIYLYFFSPGKSIFLYQPVIIFSLFGMKKFFHAKKQIFIAFFLLTAVHILFFSKYTCIVKYACAAGDLAWGPRFLYPILPFFIFALAYFIKDIKHKTTAAIFSLFILFSFVIQFSSFAFSFHRYFAYMNEKYHLSMYQKIYTNPEFSPLLGQWKLIFKSGDIKKDKQALREAFQDYPEFNYEQTIGPFDLFFFRPVFSSLSRIFFSRFKPN